MLIPEAITKIPEIKNAEEDINFLPIRSWNKMRTTEAAGMVSELIEKATIGVVPKPSTFLDIASQHRLTIILLKIYSLVIFLLVQKMTYDFSKQIIVILLSLGVLKRSRNDSVFVDLIKFDDWQLFLNSSTKFSSKDFLLIFAIFRKIFTASSTRPFSISHCADSQTTKYKRGIKNVGTEMVKRNSFQVPTQTASQGLNRVPNKCVNPYTRLIPKFLFSGRKYSTTKI
jgi:hypothetical protein